MLFGVFDSSENTTIETFTKSCNLNVVILRGLSLKNKTCGSKSTVPRSHAPRFIGTKYS